MKMYHCQHLPNRKMFIESLEKEKTERSLRNVMKKERIVKVVNLRGQMERGERKV